MKINVVPSALATIDEVTALLQAAQFAATPLKEVAQSGELTRLSEAINNASVAADAGVFAFEPSLFGAARQSRQFH